MRGTPDEGRYRQQPETINEYLQQYPDDDPLQLLHLGDEEFADQVIRLSLFALTPSAQGPETGVRVDIGSHPSPLNPGDALSSASSGCGDLPA